MGAQGESNMFEYACQLKCAHLPLVKYSNHENEASFCEE